MEIKNKVILGTASLVIGLGACTNGNFEHHGGWCAKQKSSESEETASENEDELFDKNFNNINFEQDPIRGIYSGPKSDEWNETELVDSNNDDHAIKIKFKRYSGSPHFNLFIEESSSLDVDNKHYRCDHDDLYSWICGNKFDIPKIFECSKNRANLNISKNEKGLLSIKKKGSGIWVLHSKKKEPAKHINGRDVNIND